MTLIETNPFLLHDIACQCAICNIQLEINKTCSIHDVIQSQNIEAYEALISISNFDCYNVNEGPQNLCKNCFQNISNAYEFQKQCNISAANIVAFLKYQQENSNVIVIKEESNVDYYKESSPAETESKQFNETISDTHIVTDNVDDLSLMIEINSDKELSDSSTGNQMYLEPNDEILPISRQNKARKKHKRVECETCHKMVGSNNIREHCRRHLDEKPYSCNICDKSFKGKSNLKTHQEIHDNHKSFLCKVCGKSFKLYRSLRKHEKMHTGDKPYSCNICGKVFSQSYTLKNHYAVHSDVKLFTCEICGKRFGTKNSLNQHSSVHMKVKILDCKLCGNQFTTTNGLKIHLKNHCKGLSK